ncbi:hypothetical protein CFN78_06785 [Amycolatopsis antarctica]|uniref:Uncharacterized protein n=1 Tax=Amycolatopsis antarctica TaxID=1854586 RepID=A0A263D7J2_9PSEU|nr:hypothetical protein [Amycolatopsis antarctica]OZM73988.1 hypothetical protein CFN78_06785 [Amycolatopsis antarctica]
MSDFTHHTPRSTVALVTEALNHLYLIEPPGLREPIRSMLRATAERCAGQASLLGLPVNFDLEVAEALVEESRGQAVGDG